MRKCLNCNNERKGRSLYCGDTCKVAWNRNKKRNTEALIKSVTGVTEISVTTEKTDKQGVTEDILSGFQDGIVARQNEELVKIGKKPKRGKDIKVFSDLPSHVQKTIDMMSTVDGKIDQSIKANRTAIAINYQHQFPDRFHSTGVAI